MQTLKIDLVSDVVCPWCAIGYARVQRAMAELTDELAFEINWRAFILNPDVPREGHDMRQHLARKYGRSEAEIEAAQHQIVAAAKGLGLHFEHFMERRSWHTFDTHRVLAWAREHQKDEAFNLALFDAYFGDAEDPTDPAVLRRIAESLQLEAADVDDIMASDRYADEVQTEIEHYQQLGISSVPSFIVNNDYLIPGAQEADVFVATFRRIAARAPATVEASLDP